MKERMWKYIYDGFLILALAVPTLELLSEIEGPGFQREFMLLYFAAYFLLALVLETKDKSIWTYRLLPAFPIVVLIISRDFVLLWNSLVPLAVFAALLFMLRLPYNKWIIPVPVIVLLIFFVPRDNMPVYVAGCLILAAAAAVSGFLKGVHRERWIILFVLAVGISCFIPSGEEPIRWEGIKGMIYRIGDFFETKWKDLSYFFAGLSGDEDVAYTGYSMSGGLSGGVSGSSREEMYFYTQGRRQPVYLNGVVFAKLGKDGFTERIESELPVNAWLALYLNALAAGDVSREEAACFSRVERADVIYAYMRTSDLLLPASTFRIDNDLKYGLDETVKKGFQYDIGYLSFDVSSRYFKRLVENAEKNSSIISYEEAKKLAADNYNLTLAYYLTEDEYYKCIEALQEMDSDPVYRDTSMVTDRMQRLADSLSEDCTTDMQKALKIEAYLRQYEYDMSVDLRDYDNYVDAFLFEKQKGYCVHYASAMVCLLRACGIPARYVQGFIYNPDNDGVIYGNNAHAWVEAYMSGIGWIRFEPTAAIQSPDTYAWRLRLRTAEDDLEPEEEPGEDEPEVGKDIPEPVVLPTENTEEEGTSFIEVLRTIGLYLLGLIGMAGIVIAIYLLVRRIIYNRLTPEQKLMHDVQTLSRRLDGRLKPGEKAGSVFDYLPLIEEESCRRDMEELFKGYYRVRFRGDAADESLVKGMRGMIKRIR